MANVPVQQSGYQTYPGFTGTDNGCQDAVYLLPPSFTYDAENQVTVPNVYLPPVVPPAGPSNDDFNLVWNTPNPPATSTATLTVTITNVNQWKCDPGSRSDLRANFAALAAALDALEFPDPPSGACLVPGATALILRKVAEIMPAPLAESLFYFYGLSTGTTAGPACPYVDLVPGMRLAIQPETYQFIGVPGQTNGYVPSGQQYVPVGGVLGADGFRRVGFEPFLGFIAAPKIANQPVGQASPQVPIGGALDLAAAAAARRWYRLLYPAELPTSGQPGDFQLGDSITLVGAETRADLEAATTSFQSGLPATGTRAPLVYSVLRGRGSIVPQIAIQVSGSMEWVSLGTTVREVVEERFFSNPRAWDHNTSTGQQFTLGRYQSAAPPAKVAMIFNPSHAPLADPRVYELPVIQGDTIAISPWG